MARRRQGLSALLCSFIAFVSFQAAGGVPARGGVQATHELVDMRTETSRTWALPDGRFRTEITVTPTTYLADDGTWHVIDNSLIATDTPGFAFENRAAAFSVEMPSNISAPLKVLSGDNWITVTARGSDAVATVSDTTATFHDALPDTDFAYSVLGGGLKEDITLWSSSAPHELAFDIIASPGLFASESKAGGIDFVDASGEIRLSLAPPTAWDAKGATTAPALAVSGQAPKYVATLSAQPGWLDAPERAFPVTVDPTVVISPLHDCSISSASPTSSFCTGPNVNVGSTATDVRRALMKFSFAAIPTWAEIQSASLALYLNSSTPSQATDGISVHQVTRGWPAPTWQTPDGSGTWWYNPGGDYATTPEASTTIGSGTGWYSWVIPDLVQRWHDGTAANTGLILRQATEDGTGLFTFSSSENSDPLLRPTLTVTYATPVSAPNVPTALSTDMTGTLPVLHGIFSDPDGGTGQTVYSVRDASGTVVLDSAPGPFVSSGTDSPYVIDESADLHNGETYTWTAQGYDGGGFSSETAQQSFVFSPHPIISSPPAYDSIVTDLPIVSQGAQDLASFDDVTPTASDDVHPDSTVDSGGSSSSNASTVILDAPTSLGTVTNKTGGPTGAPPPDPTIAAGPSSVILAINDYLCFYKKISGAISYQKCVSTSYSGWFGLPSANWHPSDPSVVYDRQHIRFVFLVEAYNKADKKSRLYFSVSATSDGLGSWNVYYIDVNYGDTTNWHADFPRLGVNDEGIFMTANMYTDDTPGVFQQAYLWVISADLYQGSLSYTKVKGLKNPVAGTYASKVAPALSIGAPGLEYMVDTFGGQYVALWTVDCCGSVLLANPPSAKRVFIGAFQAPPVEGAEQLGTTTTISFTVGTSVAGASYRAGHLWTSHTVRWVVSGGDNKSAVRVLELGTSSQTLLNSWTFGLDSLYYYHPQVTTNTDGDQTLVYQYSGSTKYVSIAYRQRINGVWQTALDLMPGTGIVPPGPGGVFAVVGDYSGVAPDVDQKDWIFSEFGNGSASGAT